MDRKTFFKEACKLGFCACTGMALIADASQAQESGDAAQTEASKQDKQIATMKTRFAKLIALMDENLDDKQKAIMLAELGKTCADQSVNYYTPFAGNPEGFIKEIKKTWAESVEYNKEEKTILVKGKKQDKCMCVMVDNAQTPGSFCNCSRGWMMQAFSVVMGQPVEAKLVESILQGDERCTFSIRAV